MGSNTLQDADALGANLLSVILVGPDEGRRRSVASALTPSQCSVARQFSAYPDYDELAKLAETNFDIAIIDLDSNPEQALEVVENLCSVSSATVMIYSSSTDSDLMIRCMRAGAREFLPLPLSQNSLAEALVRATARRSSIKGAKKADGRVCVFWGAKGASGVTTIASNFALLAARESGQRVLLIDLDLPLGDAALGLGLSSQYSTIDALKNGSRLDGNFLSRLLVKHSSGLMVLAAPGKVVPVSISTEAIAKLIAVARQGFDYVVIDSGSRFDLAGTALFDPDSIVYLVSQVGIPELRNANRLISGLFAAEKPRLEIILNRYRPSSLGVDDEHITRALTRPAQWKIPEDSATARLMQSTSTPLAEKESAISRAIKQMARAACGLPVETEKRKKLLNLF